MKEGAIYTVDSSLVDPIVETVMANTAVLIPAGLGITAILIGARMIPRIFKSLVRT